MNKTDILSEVKNELRKQMVNKQENTEISKQAQGEPEYLFWCLSITIIILMMW
ncbi:Uncharacterised protein [Serratia rubidaea]|uniref:Uncharacterized protein n=1 Tax=Serratia rubidaea TaxID=61652 RepID=A0A3S4JVK3_SERRU|nr:Uncharacterised protein [Serratia rubidaea]